jgi:hypothetical protein
MGRKIKLLLFVFYITACLPAIAMAQSVSYNYAQGVDFSLYRTYEWVDIDGASGGDQVLDREIKQAKSFTPDPKKHMLDKAAGKLLKSFPPKPKY